MKHDHKPVTAAEHQPKKHIEMKLSISDLNPVLNDDGMLYISIPAVHDRYILQPELQIRLEDDLGKDQFQFLEDKIRKTINAGIIANLLGSRIESN